MIDTLIVANPVSGSGRGRGLAERAARSLREAGRRAELVYTARGGNEMETVRSFADAGGETVVVVGGDGTIHEVVNAVAGRRTTVGLVSCGRGNDLARSLGIPRDPESAIGLLSTGRTRTIDLGRVGDRVFTTVASAGLDAEVGLRVHAGKRRLGGTAAYVTAFLATVGRHRSHQVRLEADFGVFEGSMLMMAVGNTPYYGGGMKIAPGADCGDGLLDVCLVPAVSMPTILRIFPRVFRGTHVRHPAVRLERTRSLRLDSDAPLRLLADGEPAGRSPVTISAWPGALGVIVP